MTAYAELVAASNFSFLRGCSRPEELAVAAAALGYRGLAICDRNTVAGVVRAHKPAKQHELKYIPGCRLVLQGGPEHFPEGRISAKAGMPPILRPEKRQGHRLEIACLPTTRAAWGRLCRLLTCGNRRAPKAECYLWLDDLIRHAEEQILILLPPPDTPELKFAEAAWDLASRFPGHVFIGAALAFDGQDARRLARLAKLASETGAPMVAIGDCLYHTPARKPLQDVVTCIREKCTIADAGYRLQRNAERHLKHPAEIARLYAGYEDAVARTVAIAGCCRFSLDELQYEYPDEPYAPFASPQEALAHYTAEGLRKKYPDGPPDKIQAQVNHELGLIEQLGYARYFLTVHDLVRYARDKGILCQGRGSAANSTVCYCLGVARELTGFPRHLSQHTGGFVIARGLLEDIVPIGNAAMEGRTFIEWDKDDLDQLGLLKVDVLALGMLTCIRKSFDLIKQLYDETLTLANVPWDQPDVYDMICRADTVGVFQIESRAQMSMLPRLKPREFYDLVIEVAIVRPGPIQGDMVHPYLRRRDGKEEVIYPSEALKAVLGRTTGVPLFQEQAMKIAIVAGGFTPGEADKLRRAMATFRHAGTIQTFGERLIEGMVGNGYERDFAERCFRQIEGFGEYGFPESHAAAFALLAYVSSWIKCRHPDIFACALLNSQPMGFYAPAQIVRDFRDHGGEAHVRPD